MPNRRIARKLLIASLGVASAGGVGGFVACDRAVVANLVAYPMDSSLLDSQQDTANDVPGRDSGDAGVG